MKQFIALRGVEMDAYTKTKFDVYGLEIPDKYSLTEKVTILDICQKVDFGDFLDPSMLTVRVIRKTTNRMTAIPARMLVKAWDIVAHCKSELITQEVHK